VWIGRIGRESAPPDRSSPGADVSERMITFGSERLREIGHSRFRQASALPDFFDTPFDVVHFTHVQPQFDELDRSSYVKDSLSVLRLGRILIDTIDVTFDRCRPIVTNDPAPDPDSERPLSAPRFSTGPELSNDRNRGGFAPVQQHSQPPRVIMTASKPKAKV
jgi:hypothetical protein